MTTRPRKIKVLLAVTEVLLMMQLLVGRKRPPRVTAADVVRWPVPCWLGQPAPRVSEAPEGEPDELDLAA
jgi:hypothetical protein